VGLLLSLACLYVPVPVRKRKLEMLFRATADAFGVDAPSVRDLSYDEALRRYALFTREHADEALRRGTEREVGVRLYQSALRIGEQFRSDLGVRPSDVMRAAALVYRMLGIDFRGEPEGDIRISRCLFSACYTADVCRLISSLDAGLLVGLAGGGALSFSQRITDGHDCCRARLEMNGVTK